MNCARAQTLILIPSEERTFPLLFGGKETHSVDTLIHCYKGGKQQQLNIYLDSGRFGYSLNLLKYADVIYCKSIKKIPF